MRVTLIFHFFLKPYTYLKELTFYILIFVDLFKSDFILFFFLYQWHDYISCSYIFSVDYNNNKLIKIYF